MRVLILFLAAVTVSHQATLYYQNSSCTSNTPCTIQVWRAVCPTPITCPTYVAGNTAWTRLIYVSTSTKPTPTGTQWVIIDHDPALQDNTTYVYIAVNAFHSPTSSYSGPSPSWSGTTTGGTNAGTPSTPTNGANNSVH